jgi:hypothetical protein
MPIRKLMRLKMTSAEISGLNIAYAKALRMLDLVDRNDPVTAIIAKEVIEVGASGVTDPQKIADIVVRHFNTTHS